MYNKRVVYYSMGIFEKMAVGIFLQKKKLWLFYLRYPDTKEWTV